MLTLYDYLPSQNAYKVRLLLAQLDLPYRQELIGIFDGEGQTEAYQAINPTGAVPAIRLDDGHVLAESNAILIHLSEGTIYLPDDAQARSRVFQWLFFEADYVQSSIATLRHWIQTGKDAARHASIMNVKREASRKVLSTLERVLSQSSFLAGDDYSIADIAVFAYVHRADEAGIPLGAYPTLQGWIERVREQPRHLDTHYPYSIDPHSGKELP